jgi:hypothetical protein
LPPNPRRIAPRICSDLIFNRHRVLGGAGPNRRSEAMATQIVMDHTGDTRHHFDATDREAVAKAEERFRQRAANFSPVMRSRFAQFDN